MLQASVYPVLGLGNETNSNEHTNGAASSIVVRQGETLWQLAERYQSSVDELVKLNQITRPDRIKEGQVLWVPNHETKIYPQNYELMAVKEYTAEKVRVAEQEKVPWWVSILRCIPAFATISRQSFSTADSGSLAPEDMTAKQVQTYEIYVNKASEPSGGNPSVPADRQEAENTKAVSAVKPESQAISRGLGRSASQEEVELLSRVIYGEARGEDFLGQVAVGAVVLNRLQDPRFPKTIQGIIYQSGAFTAVDDRQIHLDPDDQAYKAAEAALSGIDPTSGALFYYNPKTATDKWIKSRTVVKRIGNHTFSI